ncbi:MAG: UbiA prenyltransferase family protein [Clostridia bacterium]|nr:UbiA prenyltransferase family protein [Clostridia bacterium]
MAKKYIKLLRVNNYIKNLFVLLPLAPAKRLFELSVLPGVFFGLFAFCALSSAVYIFNDLCDVKRDTLHPEKKNRPVVIGEVSRKEAVVGIIILIIVSVSSNCVIAANPCSWILMAIYLLQNILYSLKLKHIPIVDVVIIANGFLIRALYGSCIFGIEMSVWLYLSVVSIALYMGFGKRRAELAVVDGVSTRKVLRFYGHAFLERCMYVCSALTVSFYSFWCFDTTVISDFGYARIIWTIPFVAIICMAFNFAVRKSRTDDVVDILYKNLNLIILLVLYCIMMVCMIYWPNT